MSTLKKQGTKAFIWDFFGKMANHCMGFVVSIFLARLLEPSDFGLITMMIIFEVATVFTNVSLNEMHRGRVKYVLLTIPLYFKNGNIA